ncbi:MAG: pyruvate:ferredoxin (flavodoxin) oxidoreductase [Clostridiales bacterium]|nr:pyruvate:ferredoxin (flavodoxin) oxidoreductase [Clostridiales bacterium]
MNKKVFKTMDGNTAAAYVAYAFTDVAAIFPITPSSPMAEYIDEWAAHETKNIFGNIVTVSELQSEAGASGAFHGSLQAGALTSTFTASQGLLLMIPNMYKIAGELLPGVFHVSARAVAAHALSIFGDHSDVMATRQTGFALLASGSVQESADLAGVAHLSAIKGQVPFVHFFDGFRTSHEIQKIELINYDDFAKLVDMDAVKEFKSKALLPENPITRGTAQNPDIFFQAKEASNKYYEAIPDIVSGYMNDISKLTGREYKLFNYVGAPDAENIIIAMGSVTDTIEETVEYLVAKGEKVGLIKVRLFRPFSEKYFFDIFPSTVKKIAVLDRTKEPGSLGEPLYQDIRTLFYEKENKPVIVGGRFGLGSKDTTPSHIKAVYDNLKLENPKNGFTLGINDDVTHLSLEVKDTIITEPEGTVRCKFWGLGSDGTVGANKSAIKIIGDKTDLYAQGYFSYDSKKSGGVTVSHLRFGKNPIKSTYLIDEADYVACHNQAYVNQYDVLSGLKKEGIFVLNCKWNKEELENHLPSSMKKYIAENKIQFYTLNATDLAAEIGLGNRINMIMQSAFFELANVIPVKDAIKYLKESIEKTYGKKGENIVKMNYSAVDKGIEHLVKIDVPESWESVSEEAIKDVKDEPDFIKNILRPMNALKGDDLPVSIFENIADGSFEAGSAAYEKRGIAVNVPEWNSETCIQCNQCSLACPHAAIRPFLANEEEMKNAPEGFGTVAAKGKGLEGLQYKIQVSTLDCTGCGVCVEVCPSKTKSLVMKSLDTQVEKEVPNWDFAVTLEPKDKILDKFTVKGSQFAQPLFEFSGACAGCGETPYMKAVTQLFGDRMIIANATGCSSIWGGSAPTTPFTKNREGKGPAWANSLFEDNAEYGFGMALAIKTTRKNIATKIEKLLQLDIDEKIKEPFKVWIEGINDERQSTAATLGILPILNNIDDIDNAEAKEILTLIDNDKNYLIKKSLWIVGGDGWAYDIGYGGLDHVLAANEDVNILVLDTEVYSNTGGQSSKATPTAAVAKFAASGKKVKKKDLGMIATTYGYVYVAQVAMGSNQNQFMKVLKEAESYNGPSLIIAYAPCIAHGIKDGMSTTQKQQKNAVDAGYWHLWRFDPRNKAEGKNPFTLDSKPPKTSFQDYLMSEARYTSLIKTFPKEAKKLFAKAEKDAKERYESYVRMEEMKY